MTAADLPTGRAGQALAVLLLAAALALLWGAVAAPLIDWHGQRAAALDARQALAARMAGMVRSLPGLRAEVKRRAEAGAAPISVLDGSTDAVAGASLQQKLGEMAARAGVTLGTAELLPAEAAGTYRRIRLRVTMRAPWPELVALLLAIADGEPGMVVDDVQIHGPGGFIRAANAPLDASWTVLAFRSDGGS